MRLFGSKIIVVSFVLLVSMLGLSSCQVTCYDDFTCDRGTSDDPINDNDPNDEVDNIAPLLTTATTEIYVPASENSFQIIFEFNEAVEEPNILQLVGSEEISWSGNLDGTIWTANVILSDPPVDVFVGSINFVDLAGNAETTNPEISVELGQFEFTALELTGNEGSNFGLGRFAETDTTDTTGVTGVYYSTDFANKIATGFAEHSLEAITSQLELVNDSSIPRYRGTVSVDEQTFNATMLQLREDDTYLVYLHNGSDTVIYGLGPEFVGNGLVGVVRMSGDIFVGKEVGYTGGNTSESYFGTFVLDLDFDNDMFTFSTESLATNNTEIAMGLDGNGVLNTATGYIASDTMNLTTYSNPGTPEEVKTNENAILFGNVHGAANSVTGVFFNDPIVLEDGPGLSTTIGGFIGTGTPD